MKRLIASLSFAALVGAAALIAHEGHDHTKAAASAASDSYPLTTCIVSGDKLGEMGEPVRYTYKQAGQPDRVIQFCCKDCIKDFEKEPATYLANLDAATHGTKPAAVAASAVTTEKSGKAEACCELVDHYVPIADALAADDLAKAKTAATEFAKQANTDGMTPAATAAEAIANAKNIAAAREALKALTKEVEPMAEGTKGYTVMYCPMANADWIQTDAKVRNPYYGKMMLTCGSPKERK